MNALNDHAKIVAKHLAQSFVYLRRECSTPQPLTVRDVLAQIRQAREYIRQGDKDQAHLLATAIAKAVVDLSTTLMGDDESPDRDLQDTAKILKMAADSSRTADVDTRPFSGNKFTRFIARFSGAVDDLRAETTLLIFRPLLWFVLLALGMKSLYIDNPTFGTSAVDYISLIFWGMSSDVASRALGSLKFG